MSRSSIVLIIFLTISIGCKTKGSAKQPEKEELAVRPTTPFHNKRLMQKLIDSALLTGNERAYNEVSSYYLLEKQEQDFFYYAFTMANKHKSAEAHYHVYLIFAMSSRYGVQKTIMNLDDRTKNLALYYLLKSHEMGYDQAKYQIEEIFGKNAAVPKSITYLQKFCAD